MHIIEQNDEFRFYNSVKNSEILRPGNYSFDWDKFGMFLKKESDFNVPDIAYDTDPKLIEQVLVTARNLKPGKNLGILLKGEKGQGKTFVARTLCKRLGLPVIIMTKSVPVSIDFMSFIGSTIQQDVVILADEFEKNFPRYSDNLEDEEGRSTKVHKQESWLSLMDGVYTGPGNKIFILSSNDEVDAKLINRPSRLRYVRTYTFIDPAIYDKIIEDELIDKSMEKDLRDHLPVGLTNIDLLREIVSEINLQKLPYSNFKEFFNFRPKSYTYNRFRLTEKEGYVYKDTIEMEEEVSGSTTRIAGLYGCTILDITSAGDIVYKINERTGETEGPVTKEISIYKLVKKTEVSPFSDSTSRTGFRTLAPGLRT